MINPENFFEKIKSGMGRNGLFAFLSAIMCGLFSHMVILTSDIPNHDGLDSLYFDQNMTTSGRWFLGTACGISSFYSLPWLTGILAIVYIAVAAVFVVKLLKVEHPVFSALIGAMMVSFPSIASNFAYVFTFDGYMLALLFAVLSVYMVEKGKFGFIAGGIFLALSLGTYQAYLSVAMILCVFKVLEVLFSESASKKKLRGVLDYLFMGIIGAGLYYVILRIALLIQHKELDTYQGIDGGFLKGGLFGTVKTMYSDFFAFSLKSRIIMSNAISAAAVVLLLLVFAVLFARYVIEKKLYRRCITYVSVLGAVVLIPLCANVIFVVSPDVTYHLLMRYQWVILLIGAVAFCERQFFSKDPENRLKTCANWGLLLATLVLVFTFVVKDNIAYSNLTKKYEKTYAYTVRLCDRIEQTEGYTAGMPIRFIGVIGDEAFPETDYTKKDTSGMIGIGGDYLIYRPENYEKFIKNYLGITLNIQPSGADDFYYEDWYVSMHPFPAADSIVIRDGVMYIKTENHERN